MHPIAEDKDDRISLSVLIYTVCAATMAVGMLCFILGICTARMHLKGASADRHVAEREVRHIGIV